MVILLSSVQALADSFSHNIGKTMSLEEFVHQAVKIFFTKVSKYLEKFWIYNYILGADND